MAQNYIWYWQLLCKCIAQAAGETSWFLPLICIHFQRKEHSISIADSVRLSYPELIGGSIMEYWYISYVLSFIKNTQLIKAR